ncbi:GatB/YqeY domain-containing protein [Candidatus Viridilinea mediisalina]|uniref:Glutamyl-tRNA amidotransferase n=1 Tax=Candidatus Viridilinea mediisalina TaxID=2024553 RepID=A0A2A6RHT3_9CHLR|nr:GatB/YqeY domain-containing protein [Candidatus Viridilinea mediisalina]PDW02446.1 glutamyl-tRNA amidotransferase [Candidatus Viridilinea mediisalina]
METISERLTSDLKAAMRAGAKDRVEVIRNARAALQNAQLEAAKQQYDAAARAVEAQYADDPAGRDAALAAISAAAHAPLAAEAQVAVIAKELKRRQDAAELYRKGGREDLAAQEEAEAAVLQHYMPQMLSPEELRPEVAAIIAELGLTGPAAMGKLMPVLLERLKGRADGRTLSQVARELLTSG